MSPIPTSLTLCLNRQSYKIWMTEPHSVTVKFVCIMKLLYTCILPNALFKELYCTKQKQTQQSTHDIAYQCQLNVFDLTLTLAVEKYSVSITFITE